MLGVIGDLVQDVVVWQLEPTRHASDTRSQIHNRRGGSAANVAAFAGPRHPTRFIGCVGDDLGGSVLRAELAARGVDVRVQLRGATGVIVVLIAEDGERLMFPSRGASTRIQPVDDADLAGIELLHCPAYAFDGTGDPGATTPGSARDAIARVRAAGGLISIDASSTGIIEAIGVETFLDLLADIAPDVLTANEDECAMLGLAEAGRAGPNLGRLPGTLLVARAGEEPTVVFAPGTQPVTVPVPPVADIRDLTGAGDAFNAGFLTTYLTGRDPVAACRAGHALAARVLRSPGATEEGPDGEPEMRGDG